MSRLLVILLLLAGFARAEEQEIAFALPELEGRISLGVFDAQGRLVRTLVVDGEEKDFKVGLNGLIAKWDGKDDAGREVPPGKYQVDGYIVGDGVKAEGVAYHFNDWFSEDGPSDINSVLRVVPTEAEGFLLEGFQGNSLDRVIPAIWKFADAASLQATVYPLEGRLFAGEEGRVLFARENLEAAIMRMPSKIVLMDLAHAPEIAGMVTGTIGYEGGVFWKDHVYLGTGKELERFKLPSLAPEGKVPTPENFSRLDANEVALVGSNPAGVWKWQGKEFQKLPLAETPEDFSLSAGVGETVWLAGGKAPDFVVRQHAFDGELLREMKLTEPGVLGIQIFADKKALRFFLVLGSEQGQTVRGYRQASGVESGKEGADWEVFLDRTITRCSDFGWVDGKLVPHAGKAPPVAEQKITLPATTLKSQPETLVLKAVGGMDGVWLKIARSLPLLCLTKATGFDRMAMVQGDQPNSLRVFAGNGTVVAEYLLTGLDNVAPIEAGEIEIPAGKSTP